MDLWPVKVQLLAWTLMSLLGLFSPEVTVRDSQLKPCKTNLCVTDLEDCDPPSPSSVQMTLNVSCYYQEITNQFRSMTCDWTRESNLQPDASLIFSSMDKIVSCQGIFNPSAVLNVTVKIKQTEKEIWSQPHTVFLFDAVKPLPPVLNVTGFTEDSLVVSWKSNIDGSCRLRYRLDNTRVWTQIPDLVLAHSDQKLTYTFRNLLPFRVYRAAVACREFSMWSDWSSDTDGRTLDRVPSRPSEVCYRVEKTAAARSLLHFMWKTPAPDETKGRILGYQVSIDPHNKIQNTSENSVVLVVEERNYNVTVQAFNTAGHGSAARLQIDTQTQITAPSVKNLWISSDYPKNKELLVQWTFSSSSSSVSHVFVEWRWEKNQSIGRWSKADGAAISAVIQDVDPEESYQVTVVPVFIHLCGSAQSLTASLQQGALMEANSLKVISVTKTTITITWAWQQKTVPIRVNKYRVMLRTDFDIQTLSLWPDQWQHTFLNLTPNSEYSLFLFADNVSRNTITVTTYFDEVPVVATVTPLLLLAVFVLIISILSRTVYKSYFFPPVSSPRLSTTGQWLKNPKKHAERNILDITDFQVMDRSLIFIDPNDQILSKDLREDKSLLSTRSLVVQVSVVQQDVENVCDTRPITEQQLLCLQSFHHDEVVFTSSENIHEINHGSPQKANDTQTPHQSESVDTFRLRDFLSSSRLLTDLQRDSEAETSDCSYLMCETGYLSNGCIGAQTSEQDNRFSVVLTKPHNDSRLATCPGVAPPLAH